MASQLPAADASSQTWLRLLGWGHAGFRVTSATRARLAIVLLLLVPFLIDIRAALRSTTAPIYSDLATYYDALQCLRERPNQLVYSQTPEFLYPPVFLTLLELLFRLPLPLGVAAFQVLKWGALYASLRLAWRLCSPPGEDAPPIVALGSLLLAARFIANDMGNANINVFVLLSLLASAQLIGRGQAALAGLILAPAIAVKLSAALLLVYFVYKGWRRAVPAALLGIVLCWLVLPALHLGWGRNLSEFGAWYNHVVASYVSTGEIWSIHLNQSLPALVNRLLGSQVAIEPNVRVALVVLPGPVLRALRLLLALLVLAGVAYSCRRRFVPRESPLAFAAEVGLVQVAMLALSGYA